MRMLLPDMNTNLEKKSSPSQPESPEQIKTFESNLSAKRIKLIPEGVNQADVDAIYKRWTKMKRNLKNDILWLGARLFKMRSDAKLDRGWTRFVERNLPFSPKAANVFIRAYEDRDSELALADWDAFMRMLWNPNKPKVLKDYSRFASAAEDGEEEDRDDVRQSGGEALSGLFPDKDKADFYSFKKVTASLEQHVFAYLTPEAKHRFIDELIKWLENQRKH